MPEGVIFTYEQKIHTVTFAQRKAVLPVKLKNGRFILVSWGRRKEEPGELPLGGWARLNSIKQQTRWQLYSPKPVQVAVDKFMEKDFEGQGCWYEVTKGRCLQGLLAREGNECRVYLVTIDPEDLMNCHYRWPQVVTEVVRGELSYILPQDSVVVVRRAARFAVAIQF